jgi:surfeit locus 1 family protein
LTRLRLGLFVTLAVVLAAICVRLGFWQVSRLHERRARNALVRSRLDSAEVDLASLPGDSTARFRRVRVTGTPDYAHQLIWAARIHNGSPGVNFLTPYRIPGRDSAVLVDRGWVYSPDAATVDEAKWRDTATTLTGFVELFPDVKGATFESRPNVVSRLSYDVVAKAMPDPIAHRYVAMIGDSVMAPDRIARLTLPPLDEGPHFSYAVQWFAFALVALIGAAYVVNQARG